MRQVSYKPINAEYLAAIKEVVRISDRKHNAWDKVKEFIEKAERLQPQQVKNDCKFSSPTGSPIASRETDTCIMVRDADNEPMRPLDAPVDDSGLLPCPFCGEANTEVPKNGEAWIHAFEQVDYMDDSGIKKPNGYYAVACCGGCGVQQCPVAYPSKEEAIKAWNTRAQPQAVAGGDEPKYHYNYSTALMNIEFEAFEDGFIVLKSEEGWHFKVAIPTTEKYSPIPQPEAAKVALDLDSAREVFENWLTAGGNYPHLKHKSFGGQYLHEEAAMKWDGFKAGYCALQTPASDGVLVKVDEFNALKNVLNKSRQLKSAIDEDFSDSDFEIYHTDIAERHAGLHVALHVYDKLDKLSDTIEPSAFYAWKWIDSNVEKPKEGHHVLVDGGVAYYCGNYSGRDEWRSASNNYIIEWDVTHWMTLPAAPLKQSTAKDGV